MTDGVVVYSDKKTISKKSPPVKNKEDMKRLEKVIRSTLDNMTHSSAPASIAFRPHDRECVVGFALKKDDNDGAWTAHETFTGRKVMNRPSYKSPAFERLYKVIIRTCKIQTELRKTKRFDTLKNMR